MDAYRSPAGREAVTRWCVEALAHWQHPHRTLVVEPIVAGTPVPTHVTVLGEGPPRFVWLPGTGACAAVTRGPLEALARRGTVWALDLPGQPGLSHDYRPRRDSTGWYSAWLDAMLDLTEGDDEVLLVGTSLGARVALTTAHRRVRSRLLVSPGGLLAPTASPALARDHTRWSLHASDAAARALLRQLHAPGEPITDRAVAWTVLVGRGCKTIRTPRPLPQHYLDRIEEKPLVVAVGEDDVLAPPAALTAAVARRASARVVVVDGCGHLLPAGAWEQVLRVLPA
ncbi:alpha/beta fold hydrolase [Arsenicicoccus dermatophilus]|uniref:alpha/beta fold hydrolase n=1 Tax=Arsenicicoccus dermatophilus TaxID=1076331 RepID=UPI001F4D061C|nr:alpha/beta hydrolase [Arsenicicoccus dermatophilus]MCH8613265.1 alpha/beta fold hydrolase [Arsenicicoccus dermatophilus]